MEPRSHTFPMLDIIRGLAALVVAERHLAHYFHDLQLPGSYLAVDIFFVLSGFVLAHAYEARFGRGLGVAEFLRIRVIRLYPLYLLAFLLGAAVFMDANLPVGYMASAMGAAALFLPLMTTPPQGAPLGTLYPFDYPTWTLLFELLVNAVHAMLAPRLSNRVLHGMIAVSAVMLVGSTLHFTYLDVGYRMTDYWAGIPRVCFSYFLGVRLYRLWQSRAPHREASSAGILLGILAVMALPVPKEYRAYYDLLAVLLFIPALVHYAASVRLARSARMLLPLGTASYAYYVLHVPFGALCDALAARSGFVIAAAAPWGGVIVLALLLALTLVLDRYYDLPLRKRLLSRFT